MSEEQDDYGLVKEIYWDIDKFKEEHYKGFVWSEVEPMTKDEKIIQFLLKCQEKLGKIILPDDATVTFKD